MLRTINFKAYRKDAKEWGEVIGYSKDDDGEFIHIRFYTSDKKYYYEKWYKTTDTDIVLLQYTGINDKNGKKIYDGYILEGIQESSCVTYPTKKVSVWNNKIKHIVEFNPSNLFLTESYSKFCEVIGNVYDNPEFIQDNTNH
jgi:uncharacterized phage protein (TIGR01671 family)